MSDYFSETQKTIETAGKYKPPISRERLRQLDKKQSFFAKLKKSIQNVWGVPDKEQESETVTKQDSEKSTWNWDKQDSKQEKVSVPDVNDYEDTFLHSNQPGEELGDDGKDFQESEKHQEPAPDPNDYESNVPEDNIPPENDIPPEENYGPVPPETNQYVDSKDNAVDDSEYGPIPPENYNDYGEIPPENPIPDEDQYNNIPPEAPIPSEETEKPTVDQTEQQKANLEKAQEEFRRSDPTQRDWEEYNERKMANKRDLENKSKTAEKQEQTQSSQAKSVYDSKPIAPKPKSVPKPKVSNPKPTVIPIGNNNQEIKYEAKPIVDKQKELQKQAQNLSHGQQSVHFNNFFKRIQTKQKEIVSRVQNVYQKAQQEVKKLPEFIEQTRDKVLNKSVNVLKNATKKIEKAQKKFKEKHIELNHPNVQGLELVRDDKNPNGFRFKATRTISIKTGLMDENNKPIMMSLEKGKTTGMIVPKGRKNKEMLAKYSHGNRFIKFVPDHDSTITMEDDLAKRDIFGQTGPVVKNSDVTLAGKAELGKDSAILNSQDVRISNKFNSSEISDSRKINLHKEVTKAQIDNSYGINSYGEVENSQIAQSSYHNSSPKGKLVNSVISYSDVRNSNGESIVNAAVNDAITLNSNVVGFENGEKTIINKGLYQNTNVLKSRLNLSDDSKIANSNVNNTQIFNQDQSTVSVVNSNLDHDTMTLKGDNIQAIDTANIDHAIMTGDNAISKSEISASSDRPTIIRNFGGQYLDIHSHNKAVKLTDKMNVNGQGKEIRDQHIPMRIQADPDTNSYRFIMHHTGLSDDIQNSQINPVQTPNGNISPSDVGKKACQMSAPEETVQESSIKKMFDLETPSQEQHAPQEAEKQEDEEIGA